MPPDSLISLDSNGEKSGKTWMAFLSWMCVVYKEEIFMDEFCVESKVIKIN